MRSVRRASVVREEIGTSGRRGGARKSAALCAAGVGLALVMGVAGGCDKTRPPPSVGLDPLGGQNYPKVAIVEPSLARVLTVDPNEVRVTKATADTPMSVVVPIRSVADNRMRVQYKFYWYDSTGRLVRESTWRPEMIEPRFKVTMQGAATDLESADWRMEIRSQRSYGQ
mgnify:CR=1 FL=1|jgi:uncharacterized protein YcfL